MTTYDNTFFEYVNYGAKRSARNLLPIIMAQLSIKSVLDVGCGQGAWLSVWEEMGIKDVFGIDGDYVDQSRLLFSANNFRAHDLANKFNLNRKFDLVESLEVAEHLPLNSAAGFVESLVNHGNMILFSAAPKGQGGDGHINEQDYEFWRRLFAGKRYSAIDFVRPKIENDKKIESWYRYNTVLYVSPETLSVLPPELRKFKIPDDDRIRDISPPIYKIRKSVVRCLPVETMTRIAKIKERWVSRKAKFQNI